MDLDISEFMVGAIFANSSLSVMSVMLSQTQPVRLLLPSGELISKESWEDYGTAESEKSE